jgi:hypothetical protein
MAAESLLQPLSHRLFGNDADEGNKYFGKNGHFFVSDATT